MMAAASSFKCYERRTVEVPDCKERDPKDCNRTYHVYLPSIICGTNTNSNDEDEDRTLEENDVGRSAGESTDPPDLETIGTLPLVFGIHCLGCNAKSIDAFVLPANSRNVVLVLPEGIQSSFNGRDCCGYALENDIDDIAFIKYIQSSLSEEYTFIQATDYSYAVGWSNGGFMVMHAATLFRAISPISGHVYDIESSLKKGGTFCVDNICVDAPIKGKGLFMHNGVDDTFVQPTGCCSDPTMPKCCCNIVAGDTCVPVNTVARNWAKEVNGCEEVAVDDEKEDVVSTKTENEDVIGSNKTEDGDVAIEEDRNEDGIIFSTSYTDTDKGIACLTTTGDDCKANTTICTHHSGHFNSPSFSKAFPFAKEVVDFFARDACEVNGKWNETSAICTCTEEKGGTFCLDDAVVATTAKTESKPEVAAESKSPGTTKPDETTESNPDTTKPDDVMAEPDTSTLHIHQVENDYEKSKGHHHVFGFFLLLAALYLIRRRCQMLSRKKNDGGYTAVTQDMEMAPRKLSPRGFRSTNY